MRKSVLLLFLLLTVCVTLTGWMLRGETVNSRRSAGALAILFGDGRRLFANHFMTKADAYFHRGRYPSFFEQAARQPENHLVESSDTDPSDHDAEECHDEDCEEHQHDEDCEHAEPRAQPDDWITRLERLLKPDQHVHLEEGNEREILPWVRLAVELDPHNVDAYAVGAYWLRRLGKAGEAEQFLREGQRNNPDSYEIYFELGRQIEGQSQLDRARRLYELALRSWEKANLGQETVDAVFYARIVGRLAHVEELAGNTAKAIEYFNLLLTASPNPAAVRAHIEELQSAVGAGQTE